MIVFFVCDYFVVFCRHFMVSKVLCVCYALRSKLT